MLSLALTLLSGSTTGAAHDALLAARADRVEVSPLGAFVRSEHGFAAAAGAAKRTAAGALWSHPDNGLAWVATAVSIGVPALVGTPLDFQAFYPGQPRKLSADWIKTTILP